MRFLIACILALILALLAPHYAHAEDLVARHPNGDTVRITDRPCANPEILKRLQMLPDRWMAAVAVVDGKRWDACWIVLQAGIVSLLYADGDGGQIPAHMFKPDVGSV